jgi:hypothetical protein
LHCHSKHDNDNDNDQYAALTRVARDWSV